jgi:hypothetical protein
MDLARKLIEFQDDYNADRVHRSLDGTTRAQRAGASAPAPASLSLTLGGIAAVCFPPRLPFD